MKALTRFTAAALGVGITAGVVVAVAVPGTSDGDDAARAAAGAPDRTVSGIGGAPANGVAGGGASAAGGGVDGRVRRVAAMRPDPPGGSAVLLRTNGRLRVVARRADPAGGPDWAVRTFTADRGIREDGFHVIGRDERCAQLGRIHRGRFGWLDGAGTFRPTRPSLHTSPTECGSRLPDLRGMPEAAVLRSTFGLGGAHPQLGATVVWGRLGSAAKDVRVVLDGRTPTAPDGAGGVVLRVAPASADVGTASVRASYDGRGERDALPPAPRPAVLAVRAADPAGGLPYGLSASRTASGWCVGRVGRVLSGRVGSLDYRTGTFKEHTGSTDGCGDRGRGRRNDPVLSETSGGEDLGDEPSYAEGAPTAGRVARRSASGLTWVAGQVRDDVRSITFRTPRDVRTIVPSAIGNAFLVVYDGQFPSGGGEKVVELENGRTIRSRLFLGVY